MEIRTYEGNDEDVARLVQKVWPTMYGGKTWAPAWNLQTLRWQILSPQSDEARDYLLAGYDGARLVGCLFADPFSFVVRGDIVRGSLLSWCTIDPDAGAPMLAFQLAQEMLRRHAAHNAAFSIGYVMGKPASPAYRFWNNYSERRPQEFRFLRKVGFWVRLLDPPAVSRAGVTTLERWGSPWLRLWQPAWPMPSAAVTIRDFRPADLGACHELVNRDSNRVDLGLVWSEDRLRWQLRASDVSESLVCESATGLRGIISFHQLTFFGRTPLRCALIDLMAGSRSLAESSPLLSVALERMRSAGLQAAIVLRTNGCPAGTLFAHGFVPLPAQDHLVALFPTPYPGILPTRRFSLMLR